MPPRSLRDLATPADIESPSDLPPPGASRRRAGWDVLIQEADNDAGSLNFSLVNEGPLSLGGVELPTDLLDFMWVRVRWANGQEDAQNQREALAHGWRPVPADLVAGVVDADPSISAAGMDGGVGRGNLVLHYRSKRASEAAAKARSKLAASSLDNIIAQYDAATTRGNLLTSKAPMAQRGYREREYRQAVPQDDED